MFLLPMYLICSQSSSLGSEEENSTTKKLHLEYPMSTKMTVLSPFLIYEE